MVVMTTMIKEKTVFTKGPRVIILVLLAVAALTRTNAFAPTSALLTSGSAVSSTAMATRSPSALLAKNMFRYCSLTGTVIAKKKKKTAVAAGRQKTNDVIADDDCANKDRVEQQQTVHGTAGHDDSRGRLTTGTGAALITWHTMADDNDEDEPHHESRPSCTAAAFGWDHQEWLYSEILQIHGPTTGRNDVEWQKRGRLWCGGARSSSTRSSKLIVVAPQQ